MHIVTRKHLCWSLFLINLRAWIIESYWNSLVRLVVLILGIISKAIWNCIIGFLDPLNPFITETVIIYKRSNCGANQWTGFYIITASIMKRLIEKIHTFNVHWVLEKPDLLILIGWMVKIQKELFGGVP